MSEVEALPEAPAVEVSPQETIAEVVTELNEDGTSKEPAKEEKPEKTEAERERIRMQRGIDRKTKQAAQARAEAEFYKQELTRLQKGVNYQKPDDDSESLSLTRAQLNEVVKAEAAKLAPTLQSEVAERQRREGVLKSISESLGKEKFDQIASDLNEAFGGDEVANGLVDSHGRPKPAVEAIFEADNPARVIEYLANPDNIDEAERISGLGAIQAAKAIAKLEAKLEKDPAPGKPIPSKAPAPLEPIKGQGAPKTGQPDPKNTRQWMAWRNEQERKGLA